MKQQVHLLLERYTEIKDLLEEYTSQHHNNMLWDIIGYYRDLEEYEEVDLDCLEKQVGLFENLLYTYRNLEYLYSQ